MKQRKKNQSDHRQYGQCVEWTSLTHPEGTVYHYTTICCLTFTTEANIYDNTYDQLLSITKDVLHLLRRSSLSPQLTIQRLEVVLELAEDRKTWMHYIVDHKSQHILWLEPFDLKLDRLDEQNSFSHASEWLNTRTITLVILLIENVL